MKLARYTPQSAIGTPRVGAVTGGLIVDVNLAAASMLALEGDPTPQRMAAVLVPPDMMQLLERGRLGLADAARAVASALEDPARTGPEGRTVVHRLDAVRLHSPIARPGKILAAGKNYLDHAMEGHRGEEPVEVQPFPRGFVKVASAVVGPDDSVELPHVTTQLDYEVELAVVIGRRGRYIAAAQAYDYVAGYTILNDVSARDIQLEEARFGNHMIGKNMDGFAPMGPWIVTADEIADPMKLDLELHVNGDLRQHSSTANMIHAIPALIERWSWGTLEPGDVIATGTPAGVALGGRFPYLEPGDVMDCFIEGIGHLCNTVVPERSAQPPVVSADFYSESQQGGRR